MGATVGASALFTAAAQADTFTVTSLGDGPFDACDTTCTLRDAISASNASPGTPNTITFAPSLTGTIQLSDGELPSSAQSLTIVGPGADQLTVAAATGSRIFSVAANDAFALSGLTLTGGDVSGDAGGAINGLAGSEISVTASTLTENSAEDGGAIAVYNPSVSPLDPLSGSVTVRDSTITGNTASGGSGGAIYTRGAAVAISGSTLSGNDASEAGGAVAASTSFGGKYLGGLFDADVATITSSTISGNTAGTAGGGLAVQGQLTLSGSAVSGNTAAKYAGGLEVAGAATVDASTITGNTAPAGAGATIAALGASNLTGSTISGNHATGLPESAPPTPIGVGGGGLLVASFKYGTDVTLSGTTVSGNTVDAAADGEPGSSGGGIRVVGILGSGGGVKLVQSTVSGNTADLGGGIGIGGKYGDADHATGGIVTLDNATVASNTARIAGGGVHLETLTPGSLSPVRPARRAPAEVTGTSTVSLSSTVVADNTAAGAPSDLASEGASDSFGGFESFFSLVETPGTAPFRKAVASTTAIDPQLGPLADNGGATQTQVPSGTSPLIDKGKAAASSETDQRGQARVVDTAVPNAPAGDGSDIGAVELPVSAVVGGAGGGQPPVVTPGTPPPPQQFSATIRGRGIAERDPGGAPRLLVATSTGVGCSVTVGSIKVCSVEVRSLIAQRIPGTTRRVAKGALLASGTSRITRDAKSTSVKLKLSRVGAALLARRPLGINGFIGVKATSTSGGHTAAGVIRLLKSNAIRVAVPTRTATLPASVLTQLDAVAKVFKLTARVTCDAYTDDGPGALALTTLQAKGACTRLVKAGIEARTVSRGHSTIHPQTRLTPATRLHNRRIVLRFTF